MRKLLLALALSLLASTANATCSANFAAATFCGSVAGGAPGPVAASAIVGTLPLPSGDIFLGNASNKAAAVAPVSAGDCTWVVSNTGTFTQTCLKTNGVAFGSLATQSSVTSAQLPAPFTNGTARGNTSVFATYSGTTPTALHVATYDVNGNIVDGGASAGTVTSVTAAGLAVASPASITSVGSIIVTAATKSDQQTGTSTTTVVTPAQAAASDSAIKVALACTVSGSAITGCPWEYNVTTATRISAGQFSITFTTPFATTAYNCAPDANAGVGTVYAANVGLTARNTTSISLTTSLATSFSATDPTNFGMNCTGRQ